MARLANKRKKVEEGYGDETQPARQNKTRPTSNRNTVKFAATVQRQADSGSEIAVPSSDHQKPKSILKTRSTPFPNAPGSPETARFPSPEPSEQLEEEELDKEETDTMSMIAAAALKMAKHAAKEQLKQDLAAAQKELEFTKNDLDNIRICWKTLEQSRDKAKSALADARAEVKEAHLAKDRVDNKFRTMEGVLKRANAQIGELQRELEVVEEEKEGMKKLLEKKMAKGDTEVTD